MSADFLEQHVEDLENALQYMVAELEQAIAQGVMSPPMWRALAAGHKVLDAPRPWQRPTCVEELSGA